MRHQSRGSRPSRLSHAQRRHRAVWRPRQRGSRRSRRRGPFRRPNRRTISLLRLHRPRRRHLLHRRRPLRHLRLRRHLLRRRRRRRRLHRRRRRPRRRLRPHDRATATATRTTITLALPDTAAPTSTELVSDFLVRGIKTSDVYWGLRGCHGRTSGFGPGRNVVRRPAGPARRPSRDLSAHERRSRDHSVLGRQPRRCRPAREPVASSRAPYRRAVAEGSERRADEQRLGRHGLTRPAQNRSRLTRVRSPRESRRCAPWAARSRPGGPGGAGARCRRTACGRRPLPSGRARARQPRRQPRTRHTPERASRRQPFGRERRDLR